MSSRYEASALVAFAQELLGASGLDRAMARVTAETLVEGDLLGHTTHGLALLPAYLRELGTGRMAKSGEPEVSSDAPAALTWDGRRLPGPWLTERAIERAVERAGRLGAATVVIRRSHHIACLAAYLRRPAERGWVTLIACSDPFEKGVAPFGGRGSLFTPNPIAASWPTASGPVILDVSQSITSLGFARRRRAEGRRLPGAWALDAEGRPTDEPAVLFADPPGTLLPSGGLDHGHKGYALALLVEALTGGLAGHGRADPDEGWSATVFVQVMDPRRYAGGEAFVRQTSHLADACRANPPRPGVDRVRLPGENGLRRRAEQLEHGVELYPSILPALAPWAEKLGIAPPRGRAG